MRACRVLAGTVRPRWRPSPQFNYGKADQKVVLHFQHEGDDPADPSTWIVAGGHPYSITLADGSKVEGTTDAQGATRLLERDAAQIANIVIYARDPMDTG